MSPPYTADVSKKSAPMKVSYSDPPQQVAEQPTCDSSCRALNPPYMDDDGYKGFVFDDKYVRAGFICRVYTILSIQLLVTFGFVCLFVLHEPTKGFVHNNPQLMTVPMVGTIVFIFVIACCENARRSWPLNVIVFGAFTMYVSLWFGFLSSSFPPDIVLLYFGLTAAIVIGLTIFALQTKVDFTTRAGVVCIVFMIASLGSLAGGLYFRTDFASFVVACIAAAVFPLWTVYDTQIMISGTHYYLIAPDENIFAALTIFGDIFVCRCVHKFFKPDEERDYK